MNISVPSNWDIHSTNGHFAPITAMFLQQVSEEACLVGIAHATAGGIFINRFLTDAAYFRVRGIRMNEYESADAGIRNHGATVQQRDAKSL